MLSLATVSILFLPFVSAHGDLGRTLGLWREPERVAVVSGGPVPALLDCDGDVRRVSVEAANLHLDRNCVSLWHSGWNLEVHEVQARVDGMKAREGDRRWDATNCDRGPGGRYLPTDRIQEHEHCCREADADE